MSNARELALLEKWTDVAAATAATGTLPSLSPTSPKATKFCCCPNRRRYNIKQPKNIDKLHPRNIFIDNDFTYIDDVANGSEATISSNSSSSSSSNSCTSTSGAPASDKTVGVNSVPAKKTALAAEASKVQKDSNSEADYDDICDVVADIADTSGNCAACLMSNVRALEQRRQDKSCHNTDNSCARDNCSWQELTEALTTTATNALHEKAAATDDNSRAANAEAGQVAVDANARIVPAEKQQPIQRLSNNPFNYINNKEYNISNNQGSHCHCNNPNDCCDFCQRKQDQCSTASQQVESSAAASNNGAPGRIDLQHKVTFPATTSAASCKCSESGLTTAATLAPITLTTSAKAATAVVAATSPTTKRSATPSLTTVITTTMVKRSPPDECAPATKVANQSESFRTGNSGHLDFEPRRSVKERIAALIDGDEKTRHHDNLSIKAKPTQCNNSFRNQCNMTTATNTTKQQSGINHHNRAAVIKSNSNNNDDAVPENLMSEIPCHKSKSSIGMREAAVAPTSCMLGSATMPRRRSPSSAAHKYGSSTAVLTADKHSGEAPAMSPTKCSRKLAALDNLDLALSLDLTDEDGEDPYCVLQEYLEHVKHEINEVFELHKARQRMQKEQQLPQESSTTTTNDELSRSIESDSGFDSASGGHIGSHNNKLFIATANETNLRLSSATPAAADRGIIDEQRTTILRALPPPPLSPTRSDTQADMTDTLFPDKANRIHLQQKHQQPAAITITAQAADANDVNIWANKFLRDLDDLMASDKPTVSTSASSSPTPKRSPPLLSAAATAAIHSRYGKNVSEQYAVNGVVLRPEKHATIPLQSFNLDCGLNDIGNIGSEAANPATTKTNVAYMRTLSAPTPYHQQQHQPNQLLLNGQHNMAGGKNNRSSLTAFNVTLEQLQLQHQQHHHNLTNFQCCNAAVSSTIPKGTKTTTPTTPKTTVLKIEEAAAAATTRDTDGEELLKSKRERQLESDIEAIRNPIYSQSPHLVVAATAAGSNSSSDKNISLASATAASIPKRERINHATTTTTIETAAAVKKLTTPATSSSITLSASAQLTSSSTPTIIGGTSSASYLLNGGDTTKKGSTSTIWTSEESILRSVGAVDEDNNSTSSSACEEASGVLSSGKSGISLDSAGIDIDNNESGIGTATPPKDTAYWRSVHIDSESVSSLDALRKIKLQKSSSVASSEDPDLLEVLSLCDEAHRDEDSGDDSHGEADQFRRLATKLQRQPRVQQHRQAPQQDGPNNSATATHVDADDDEEEIDGADEEGHDEFETTVPYCDCDYNEGNTSHTSGGANNNRGGSSTQVHDATSGVVLRRKYNATPVIGGICSGGRSVRAQKSRSHSLDTSLLPTTYQHHPHYHHHQHFVHTPLSRKLHHLHSHRTKERGQLSLTLRQEPFQSLLSPTHFQELPSPSSASLHSGHDSLGMQELTAKSNSAPLLLKQEKKRDDFAGQKLTLRYSRSQSDRYLAEIEAVEACKWLRAAGFPQYAQMYEDHQFPLDLTNVAKDHTNLENDQLQSLYRRLCILNRCANMRLDQSHKTQTPQKEDSDDENFALSENWTFQPHIRRWSRIGEMGLELPPPGKLNIEKAESSSKDSSPDRFDDDAYDATGGGLSLTLPGDSTDTTLNESTDASLVRLRRTGSERLKDGAKAFLRRVESIKSRRRKRQNREGIVISGPQALDLSQLGQRSSTRKPDGVYSTPPSPSAVSPMHTFPKGPFFGNELKVPSNSENFLSPNRSSPKRTPTTPRSMRTSPLHFFSNPMPHLREGKSDDSSSYYSDSQESSAGGKLTLRKTPSKTRRFLQRTGKVDDIGAHSDSECHQGRKFLIKDANSNTTEVKIKKLTRGGSLNLGKDPKKREGFRSTSFRSRSTTRKEPKVEDSDHVKKTPVVRWHSFQMEERPHMIFRKCFSQKIDPNSSEHGVPFAAMSAGQLQIIRKLALVILTGHMERYCPTHRSGWNWELPKFIKKIKMPDYKDKKVFGVPLLLILQRTGQTLPIAVRSAFRWLQLNALDQIGLFRKSGVKSRIIKLKELIECSESAPECMDVYDEQQAYDVADMLKQYFRDLPESLLTTKMSETFAAIFQHLPPDVRLDAIQCAVLLLPDENREILFALLEFLTLVAANSQYNQMTANNLAVCLAPSLFHSSISTGAASVSASPRRRGKGVPDAKELSEAKASHECLAFMIENYKQIYTASKEKISKCNFGYMEESKPVPLEALGEGMQFHNWRGYLYECTSATIKEGREKARGWMTITSQTDANVDIAYKKVGDGHPLRLWRCVTEVEGPPKEVLDYIIKQRASWDCNLLQSQTIKTLDERTEIFQYMLDGQYTIDFCVLRSWQTDLPRGACVIVETSIEHSKAKAMFGAVRGVVLASRYLIEPCGSGRSRVMHLARVDVKGKTPEWYNKSYGHICSHYLSKIRLAFKHVADGPESKV